jgi:hypothetical protein
MVNTTPSPLPLLDSTIAEVVAASPRKIPEHFEKGARLLFF